MDSLRVGMRGQSSLEALIALAALLCAFAVLAHSAKGQTDAFASAMERADARTSLAHEAFYIDLSASAMQNSALQRNLSGVPSSDGKWLASRQQGAVREPLFHKISIDSEGKCHVQQE